MKQRKKNPVLLVPCLLGCAVAGLASGSALGAGLAGDELVEALRSGGYVIVMRHGEAEAEAPSPQQRVPANVNGERQLTADARNLITAQRAAFRRLGIRVGDVYTSPEFRAVESAEHFGHGFRRLQRIDALGVDNADPDWLREMAAAAPAEGRNTLIFTHARNATGALGEEAADLDYAEALIYRAGDGDAELVARMAVGEWATLGRD